MIDESSLKWISLSRVSILGQPFRLKLGLVTKDG